MVAARTKNIIDMALSFSAMGRVFKPNSSRLIHGQLEKILGLIHRENFEELHSSFCRWFMKTIETSKGCRPSYGQAAKVLDVTLKVIVYYCQLPQASVAVKIVPRLHFAVDTPIMLYLKRKYHVGQGVFTLSQVGSETYKEFQSLVNKEAKEVGYLPVEYDDILWRRLNR